MACANPPTRVRGARPTADGGDGGGGGLVATVCVFVLACLRSSWPADRAGARPRASVKAGSYVSCTAATSGREQGCGSAQALTSVSWAYTRGLLLVGMHDDKLLASEVAQKHGCGAPLGVLLRGPAGMLGP